MEGDSDQNQQQGDMPGAFQPASSNQLEGGRGPTTPVMVPAQPKPQSESADQADYLRRAGLYSR